jgi:antitoxin PrlF
MRPVKARLAAGGRLVIPADYRKALGLRVGDEVILRLEGHEVRISTPDQAIQRAQELVERYVADGRSLVAELIAERRAESARD